MSSGRGSATQYGVLAIPKQCTVAELRSILDQLQPQNVISFGSLISPLIKVEVDKIRVPVIIRRKS